MLSIRDIAFRAWYWYVSKIDKKSEVVFMNYGYSDEKEIELDQKDEFNRYSIQLYNLLASATEIKDKDIIEVGCGRGGGLSWVVENHKPKTAIGIDLNKKATEFNNKNHKLNGLSFLQGDAQKLDMLEDNSVDAVFNVESSHRYPDFDAFLSQVHRVLRPGGHFLFTDFRFKEQVKNMEASLEKSPLKMLKKQDTNDNAVKALELNNDNRHKIVNKLTPTFLKKTALNFAGVIGSDTYNKFKNRDYIYYNYVFQKNQ